ncbi:Cupin-domain-containing oxidoreductase virC [Cladobotryum mycophilum]|uniref:Cupin-domain-containing oxidoreductase virC n=1 Tax=Cladobotryum mycophilum TaxID=491253 RepID=A0ABR0SWL0_9HYPO
MASSQIKQFPADGLRHARRVISGHNKEGKGVFVVDDDGDHHRIICGGEAVGNIIYSTKGMPVDMNDDKDLKFARDNEPSITVQNGSVCRLIDFVPGMVTPLHRAKSIDYGIVIEGKFELTLDSGEKKVLLPGDMSVNRGCMLEWRNLDTEKAGRMLFVLLDIEPLVVNGKTLGEELLDLDSDYVELKEKE